MNVKLPILLKYAAVAGLLIATTISCSSEILDDLTGNHPDELNELILAHHFNESKAFSSLPFEVQSDFLKSFQYNKLGEVISFHLDQEDNNLTDEQFSELICLAVKSDAIQLIDEETTRNFSITMDFADDVITGNPPLTYKGKRNNSVGGCDRFKGSLCVIRW